MSRTPLPLFEPIPLASKGGPMVLHSATRPFHVLTKPIGPICNLDCRYCFYLEKESLYPSERKWKMDDTTLDEYVRQYIASQPGREVSFAWQGGEPTLLGVNFFRRAVELQRKYADGKRITNALQTNGTLLDDEWCEFLAKHEFLIGLSIDGPRELHDHYRVDKKGEGSFDEVVRGLNLLKKHGVEFNTLTVVNRVNSRKPLEVYSFLREFGSGFMQFIPLVEREATDESPFRKMQLDLAGPPEPGKPRDFYPVTPWSVRPEDYGRFLCTIFDEWVRRDVGKVFVQMFDVSLGNWVGAPPSLCVFSERCGRAVAIEHNGDLYSCDHYVYPAYKLGNILETQMADLIESPFQQKFGNDKFDTLPQYCRRCDVRFACHGECPKHRFLRTPDGEEGLNYLCAGYKMFFNHIDPFMKRMAELLSMRQPPALIMNMVTKAGKLRLKD